MKHLTTKKNQQDVEPSDKPIECDDDSINNPHGHYDIDQDGKLRKENNCQSDITINSSQGRTNNVLP